MPIRYGVARFKGSPSETFLDHEFWVTKKPAPPGLAERFYVDVDTYANNEPLGGNRKVVWYKSAFNHVPRYEDLGFGLNNSFSSDQGVASTVFTGFDLMPRNLMFKSPLYTP